MNFTPVSSDPTVFNNYFGITEGALDPHKQAFSAGIKDSVLAFYNVLDISIAPPSYDGIQPPNAMPHPSAPQPQYSAQFQQPTPGMPYQGPLNPDIHHHNQGHQFNTLNNPFFWMWIGSNNRQPRYHTYRHRTVGNVLSMRANQVMAVAGSGRAERADRKKNEEEAKKKIFLIGACIALADIVAAVAAIYVTAIAVKQASDASKQKNRFNQIAHSIQLNIPYSGNSQDDPTIHLQEIGRNLKEIGNREARCSKYRAISVAVLATAGVGAVHVACSAIACTIITGSASLSASASGIAALAFFSASCAPPVLLAVGTIAAVGIVIYIALQAYDKQAKDRHNAQAGLVHLNALTQLALNQAPPAYNYVAPSAPPMPPPPYQA